MLIVAGIVVVTLNCIMVWVIYGSNQSLKSHNALLRKQLAEYQDKLNTARRRRDSHGRFIAIRDSED